MLLATIRDTANYRSFRLQRCNGATAPAYFVEFETVCGYWETRLDLFDFALSVIGIDPDSAEWIDGFTGEILTYDELATEAFDIYENEV